LSTLWEWFAHTLRAHPEIAVFLALGIGYWVGGKSFKGIALGAVTATLLTAIAIGQLGITISSNVKSVFFLLFLFSVGYGVGPQFVRGIAKDGVPQALFAVVISLLCLGSAVVAALLAGYDVGSAAGLYAGASTTSASMGLATDAINRIGLPPADTKALLDAMPVAYAVTYIFGTIGSAIVLSMVGPAILGVDLEAACRDYEEKLGGGRDLTEAGTAWHRYELRAYRVAEGRSVVGCTVAEAEQATASGARLFVERIRRGGELMDATADTVIEAGDVLAIAGRREDLVRLLGSAPEVEDRELLAVPAGGVDVLVTSKAADRKTLSELASWPTSRGVFLRRIVRGATATEVPILPGTVINRGDILTLVGRQQDLAAAAKVLGFADKPSDVTDVAFIGAAITLGALIGAVVLSIGGVPVTLSTAGGTLIAGLAFGWLRSVHPTFGRIPRPVLWFMNSVGLNVFIAVVGITAGPGFVLGLQKFGISLFLWGIFVTSMPLLMGMFVGKFIFRFHPAILFGAVAGARTSTASLGMISDRAKSQIPALGYTVTYAVSSPLLAILGMVIVMLLG